MWHPPHIPWSAVLKRSLRPAAQPGTEAPSRRALLPVGLPASVPHLSTPFSPSRETFRGTGNGLQSTGVC